VLYRLFIDEVGNHDLLNTDAPGVRFLCLTGLCVEADDYACCMCGDLQCLKTRFFADDPDLPRVILHRKDIVNKRGAFYPLTDPEIQAAFNKNLLTLLKKWNYLVIAAVIDKKAHRERYTTWCHEPYHYCLQVIIERYVRFLENSNASGDVMVEARTKTLDRKLAASYGRLWHWGTDYVSSERMQERLTSKALKVKPKIANIAGLQVADLIAHPARRLILRREGVHDDNRRVFGDEVAEILAQTKFYRCPYSGDFTGWGTKLLP